MSKLKLNLLGNFQAFLDGVPVSGFNSDKTRALLAYLAIERNHAHRRETLAALLWPDVPEASARQSLSQALSNLRKLLKDADSGAEAAQPFILADRESVQFNPHSDFELDTQRLEISQAGLGRDWRLNDDSIPNPQSLISSYRAPLLHGFTLPDAEGFEEWLLLRRESLQRSALEMLDQAISQSLARDTPKPAIELSHKQLEIDPWREDSHRNLMRAYALNGQRSDALAQFEKCKKVLQNELGVPPSAETVALFAQIKKDEGVRRVGDEGMMGLGDRSSSPHPIISSSPRPLNNLPTSLTAFVGRERDLLELKALIANPEARLITLVGAGGMGKTRLAIEAAHQVQAQFANGVAFVPLASVTTGVQMWPAFAQALGIPLAVQTETQAQLLNTLKAQQVLCVVDNLEHMLSEDATVGLLMALLQAAPGTKLLVTSREVLAAPGEWVFELDGLGDDAQVLFGQTARRVQAQWQNNSADAKHIEKICRLVGGMPLGVELAASWLRLLSCAEVAEEIERNLDFLATTARHVDERHRSITAVFDASWKLLSDEERRVLGGLSAFRSGFTREAAKAVAGASLLTLSALVSKSLVRRAKANRYDVHELVRQYAAQGMAASEYEATRDSHQRYFAQQADALEPAWLGRNQAAWLPLWLAEMDNLRAAMGWAFDVRATPTRRAEAVRLMAKLPSLWRITGELSAIRVQLGQLMLRPNDLPKPTYAWALLAAGYMALWQADADLAQSSIQEGIALMQQPDSANPFGVALGLVGLGDIASLHSDYPQALAFYQDGYNRFKAIGNSWGMSESLIGIARHTMDATLAYKRAMLEQALAMKREIGDDHGMADAMGWLSVVTQQMGDFETTRTLHQESLALQKAMSDKYGAARTLNRMGEMLRQQGSYDQAMPYYTESLTYYRELGIPQGMFFVQHNLGHVLLAQGEVNAALHNFKESLKLCLSLSDKEGIALALAGLGGVAVARGRASFGVICLGVAERLLNSINYYFESTDRIDYERNLAAARAQLSEAEFAAVVAQAQAADYEVVAQEAMSL